LQQHPTFSKSFARYQRAFGTVGPPRLVQYRPTSFDQGGRLYAQTPSAQLFPKHLRVSLFGHTHFDVDMIQAHYELIRNLSSSPHLLPAWQMRQWVKSTWTSFGIPEFPDFEKQWPTRILNMATVQEMRNSLVKLGCRDIPGPLDAFIQHLYAAKMSVINQPLSWCPRRCVEQDQGYSYRILENIERTVLLKLLDTLQSLMSVESIVFIHDGFLIAPEPPPAVLQQAQTAVLSSLQILTVHSHSLNVSVSNPS